MRDGELTSKLKIRNAAVEAARRGDTREYQRLMRLFQEAGKKK